MEAPPVQSALKDLPAGNVPAAAPSNVITRVAPMSRKHDNLLRAIFQDPVSGNIQWREVESLLHHLGATTEPLAKARLRVKLNGVEGTLHRPHHGDALGRQDILHIREYLAHARATPSQYEALRKG